MQVTYTHAPWDTSHVQGHTGTGMLVPGLKTKLQVHLTVSYFFFFHFSDIAFFHKQKVYSNLEPSKSIGISFPTALTSFLSLYHILVSFMIFQTFFFDCYSIFYMMICVQQSLMLLLSPIKCQMMVSILTLNYF